VTPAFFKILGDKIVIGAAHHDEDNADTRPVAVVNEAFARRSLARENPIGQHFGPAPQKNAGMYEIVGVASTWTSGVAWSPMYSSPSADHTLR